MKIAISVPSGFHKRELLMPQKGLLEADPTIERVIVITPAAAWSREIFPDYGAKFEFAEKFSGRPDVLVTTTSGLDAGDVDILQSARTAGVPTFTFIASWDNVWKMERLAKQGKPQVLADQLVVWNQMMADYLRRIWPDLSPERITVIGAPRLDYFFHADKIPSAETLREYLGITDDGQPLLHLSTTELYPLDYVAQTIRQAFPQAHLYASVHPGGNMARHEGLKKLGATVRFSFGRQEKSPNKDFLYNPSEADIYMLVALFKYSSALINHSSTTAIESLLADVPVINVKYGQPWDWWRWYRSMVYRDWQQHYDDLVNEGATTIVRNKQHLVRAITESLENPAARRKMRQQTLKKMITTTDGTASQQMFNAIKQCAAS